MNPATAIKPQNQNLVNQSLDTRADAFQKVLKQQQLTQREAHKNRDIATHASESQTPTAPQAAPSDVPEKLEPGNQASRQPAKKETTHPEKTSLGQARDPDDTVKREVKGEAEVQLLDQLVAYQDPGLLKPAVEYSQPKALSGEEEKQNSNLPEEIFTTENPVLPMLNMLNLSSVIQSKLDAAGTALESNESLKNTTGLNVGVGTKAEYIADSKMALNSPIETNGAEITQLVTEQRQPGFNQKLTEALKESTNNDDALVIKPSQKLDSLAAPINVAMSSPALATAINNPQTVTSNTIAPQLGSPAWNDAIGQKIIWMVGAEQQSATLTLNPPDLGPVQVVIQVHNEQADATFISQNPEVRQALEDGLDNLRNMMTNSGIALGQANVHAEQQSQQHAQPSTAGTSTAKVTTEATQTAALTPTGRILVSDGLVDTFA